MRRPVYILGAGFSKTINNCMPITAELNKLLEEKHPDLRIDLQNQTFENWLTVNSTDLPFLEKHENTARRAQSEKIVSSVGEIIEELTNQASRSEIPLWLEQLIKIWHAEKAIVITLNYDTLIERAVNTCNIHEVSENLSFKKLYSENITHPSPQSTTASTNYDQTELIDNNSFQLIKLHGSINWFHAHQDITGISTVKARVRDMFSGERTIKHTEKIISEFTLHQDRLIIPPVTTKDSFYSSHISSILWKSARKFIQETPRLTIIGYSLPPEDFITGQLIKEISRNTQIIVADKFASNSSESGIIKNLQQLGLSNPSRIYSGEDYILDLVSSRITSPTFSNNTKVCFIVGFKDSNAPTALLVKKGTSEFFTLNYNSNNEFKDHGMPIHEEIENLYPTLNPDFNIYYILNETSGKFSIDNQEYLILGVQEFPRYNLATVCRI